MPNIIPAKAEVIEAVWICAKPQQLTLDAVAGKSARCVLLVSVCEIPENAIAARVNEIPDERNVCLRGEMLPDCSRRVYVARA